jgi:hypothetical protein
LRCRLPGKGLDDGKVDSRGGEIGHCRSESSS